MLNSRFTSYFHDTFFEGKNEEFQSFVSSLEQPIPRTIRIKPGKESQVKENLEKDGWILSTTDIARVYSIDRRSDFDPIERRLGFSLDHLLGNFYIQELAAATPVHILADQKIQNDTFLILDMASSPGGKTTQLAEYFPNSFIVANEPTRERIPQLLQNLDRMKTPHVGITLYPGQFWKNIPETFDRILLDAPCSGEGTLYKGTDAVKHWHLKNIKEIARLQTKLLDAAIHSLKVGGELVYSTCSLNLIENESIIEALYAKYKESMIITFQKKFWPHIDKTGGFFITKIQKIQSLETRKNNGTRGSKNEKLKVFRGDIYPWKLKQNIKLYEHDKKILAVKNNPQYLENIYYMRFGEQIGNVENGKFEPNNGAHKYIDTTEIEIYEIMDALGLDNYLRGNPIIHEGKDAYINISYNGETLGIEYRKNNIIQNTFPKDWRRR